MKSIRFTSLCLLIPAFASTLSAATLPDSVSSNSNKTDISCNQKEIKINNIPGDLAELNDCNTVGNTVPDYRAIVLEEKGKKIQTIHLLVSRKEAHNKQAITKIQNKISKFHNDYIITYISLPYEIEKHLFFQALAGYYPYKESHEFLSIHIGDNRRSCKKCARSTRTYFDKKRSPAVSNIGCGDARFPQKSSDIPDNLITLLKENKEVKLLETIMKFEIELSKFSQKGKDSNDSFYYSPALNSIYLQRADENTEDNVFEESTTNNDNSTLETRSRAPSPIPATADSVFSKLINAIKEGDKKGVITLLQYEEMDLTQRDDKGKRPLDHANDAFLKDKSVSNERETIQSILLALTVAQQEEQQKLAHLSEQEEILLLESVTKEIDKVENLDAENFMFVPQRQTILGQLPLPIIHDGVFQHIYFRNHYDDDPKGLNITNENKEEKGSEADTQKSSIEDNNMHVSMTAETEQNPSNPNTQERLTDMN